LTGLGLVMILFVVAQPASAHGGGVPQLTNAPAGPYTVSVWTQPDPIRAGKLHITVAVMESPGPGSTAREAGDVVLDATVRVQLEPLSQTAQTLLASATRDNAVNKLFYEADLELPAEGQWHVLIEVEGPAGAGQANFDIEALPPSKFGALQRVAWPVWGGLALAILAAGWLLQTFLDRPSEAQHA